MSWCNKLASTPAVGIRLDKLYGSGTTLLAAISPIVSQWVDNDKQAFTVDQQDTFGFVLSSFSGYTYAFNAEIFSVEFRHRLRLRGHSGGPPTAEMISRPLPYTDLLDEVSSRLLEATRLAVAGQPRKLRRIGIMTTTQVSAEEAPPGILRFVDHLSKPWSDGVPFFNVQMTAKLPPSKVKGTTDRCVHALSQLEGDDDELLTVRLDFQREFDGERNLSVTSLKELLEETRRDALAYFEDIGVGERFDEILSRDK